MKSKKKLVYRLLVADIPTVEQFSEMTLPQQRSLLLKMEKKEFKLIESIQKLDIFRNLTKNCNKYYDIISDDADRDEDELEALDEEYKRSILSDLQKIATIPIKTGDKERIFNLVSKLCTSVSQRELIKSWIRDGSHRVVFLLLEPRIKYYSKELTFFNKKFGRQQQI